MPFKRTLIFLFRQLSVKKLSIKKVTATTVAVTTKVKLLPTSSTSMYEQTIEDR